MKLFDIQKNINATQCQNNKINIAVLSNITLEPYFNALLQFEFSESAAINVFTINYEDFEAKENLAKFTVAYYIVVFLNFDNFYSKSSINFFSEKNSVDVFFKDVNRLCLALYQFIKEHSNSPVLWFGFEDYCYQYNCVNGNVAYNDNFIDILNNEIYCLLRKQDIYIDLKRIIAKVGIQNSYNNRGKYRWNAPYSKVLLEAAVKEIHKQYFIMNGITKKCLVLDCDNVLWGGILSEDGIENLELSGSGLGRVYQDFQRFVLSLYYHGVILAVCSKNDLPEVLTMFRRHSEMVLREEHIACFQVNWEDKPSNIKKIAEKLNIGLESMVFVDDSPVEIEAVKVILPEITTILFKRDMEYEQFSCFNLKSAINIIEIEKRNETYRTNSFREELKANFKDYADYIKALDTKMDIHEAMPIGYCRIAELTQRTNKCTNGKRYTVAELRERIASDTVKLYSISVSDRFADLGLVGAIEIEGDVLTLFSLSCRALGREIERKMLNYIGERYQINSVEYHSTGKNEAIKALLLEAFPNAVLTNSEND